jgi:hypothetical protein
VRLGPGLAVCETAPVYCPRNPEESILYGVEASPPHSSRLSWKSNTAIDTFPQFGSENCARSCSAASGPTASCVSTATSAGKTVSFLCVLQRRGFCSSCGGRRMADTAAHLVDRVLPEVPVRHWALSLPFALRYRLAYDARMVREVLRIFVQAVFGSLRRQPAGPMRRRKPSCSASATRSILTSISHAGAGRHPH